MTSLRELIYSQTASSQGSAFFTPKPPPRISKEPDPRPPEKIVGTVVCAVPCTKKNYKISKKIAKQYPVYCNSPAVKAERDRELASEESSRGSSLYAPGLSGFYVFPQLSGNYNDAHRKVVRQLWEDCIPGVQGESAVQLLRVLCKLDAVELNDLAKTVYVVKDGGNLDAMKQLIEGLYKLVKAARGNLDRSETLTVLIDYYVLVEGNYAIAQDLTEGNPTLACTAITLMCLKCFEMVEKIKQWQTQANRIVCNPSDDGHRKSVVEGVLNNPALFADTITLLKTCLASPSYGQRISVQGPALSETSDSDGSDDGGARVGYKRKRHAGKPSRSRSLSMDTVSLPAKREISGLLSALGTAVRTFLGRRRGRDVRSMSEMTSNGSVSSSHTSTSREIDNPQIVATTNDDATNNRAAGYTMDVHLLCAVYLHALGEQKEARREMHRVTEMNTQSHRAYSALFKFMCRLHAARVEDIVSSVDGWVSNDRSSKEAMYISLLLFKKKLKDLAIANRRNNDFALISVKRRMVDVLCNFIESVPPILPTGSRTDLTALIYPCDLLFPFFSARKATCASEGGGPCPAAAVDRDETSVVLVSAWMAWRALATILGPLSGSQRLGSIGEDIFVWINSEYFTILDKHRLTSNPSFFTSAGIKVSVERDSGAADRRNVMHNHFEVSRRWWKSSMLSWYSLPYTRNGIDISGDIPLVYLEQRLSHASDNNISHEPFDWLVSAPCNSDSSSVNLEWSEVLRIGKSCPLSHCCHHHNNDQTATTTSSRSHPTQGNMLMEILWYQIVVSSHLHLGCQDNLYVIRGIHYLLSNSDSHVKLSEMCAYFKTMNVDVARALRLALALISNGIFHDTT